ncbi:LacI family DNA-binding transcriptional regulator [Rhodococcus sp. T2V]|uniref:LacI family DNA-binding transcriptional regulator n=1 Tax=Rhodococcus sp. T2V TaxID=3034164 RepID=UPI0023E0A69B|nr:LacI family DNA-binding transcriptional regulator [Rhodococcus sp. T2V]MDF3311361.1 LacI family DNA-binding transcriptional regulator [Rhodococcus sp. T2V]
MTRAPRPSIKDVASAAGVSPTTVSDALSGKGRLPMETRLRVREVADRLGYRPSALARGLRNQRVGFLGFVLVPAAAASVSTVNYWIQLQTKAAEFALDRGYALVMLPPDPEGLTPVSFPVDGVIVVDPLRDDQVLATLRNQRVPLVTVGRDLTGGPEPWIDDDQTNGALKLLQAVAHPGDRVALVTLPTQKSYLQDINSGVNSWRGHAPGYPIIHTVESVEGEEIDPVVARLMQHEPPDLILGANERITLSIHRALKSAGYRIPTDVRLASMVESPDLERVQPPVSAAIQHPVTSAEMAVTTIIDLIRGQTPPPSTLIPMDLAIRASAPAVSECADQAVDDGVAS